MLSKAWSPGWSSFDSFSREMDEVFDRFFSSAAHPNSTSSNAVTDGVVNGQAETFLRDGKWVLRLDLPGVEPKDIDVSVTGDNLTIRASREWRRPGANDGGAAHEIHYGKFERSLTLPKGTKSDQIKASYQHGVLELTIPASPELAGRKIPIAVEGKEQQQLENKAA
jgi:HSP20 family protein